ncbi:E3 ubiquitin-protein ligase RSL1 [Silene latifolia]|uniref:E3 ubiquitin-protein ligase RSL1 n=1 Tax=Silene latifolia TaxID=37657 RepID=UPI003D77C050
MLDQQISDANLAVVAFEEDEDEFRSCCGEDSTNNDDCDGDDDDESIVKIYFKGISVNGFGKLCSGFSGIGVVIIKGKVGDEDEDVSCCVQKRLDFYVENWVADYLALIDGLGQVLKSDVTRVFGFTDSQIMYEQIMLEKSLDKPLMVAFRERILELVRSLESFTLKLVPSIQVQRPLQLAQVALGLVSLHEKNCSSMQNCSICCDDKPSSMMLTLCCSHKFCSHCLMTYADGKLEARQVPVRCPQPKCNYFISSSECKLFLPVISYNIMEKALGELNVLRSEKMYCPHHNCSALIDPRQCLSDESSDSCVECPVCQRSVCVNCGVPWHNSLSCGEYQDLPLEERDASDVTLHRLALDRRWRRCQQCHRMIELTQGCYHMTCWCGHEFCYACGAEYTANGQQTCQCAFWDEGASEDSNGTITPEEQWQWNSFDNFPMILDAYSDQERSQLALIQRFLAGGFSLSDHHPCQSPTTPACTDSYVDVMKDLHQLPWLERFVSVISDNYDDDYTH